MRGVARVGARCLAVLCVFVVAFPLPRTGWGQTAPEAPPPGAPDSPPGLPPTPPTAPAPPASTVQEPVCVPSCRAGYLCVRGTCVSQCNPPCPDGLECSPAGECVEPGTWRRAGRAGERRAFPGYVGGSTGGRASIHGFATSFYYMSFEVGKGYVGFDLDMAFNGNVQALGPMFAFRVPIALSRRHGLYLEPGMALGPEFWFGAGSCPSWDSCGTSEWLSVRINPRLRVRWDVFSSFSVVADVISVDIWAVQVNLKGGHSTDVWVFWNAGVGAHYRF